MDKITKKVKKKDQLSINLQIQTLFSYHISMMPLVLLWKRNKFVLQEKYVNNLWL